MNKNIYILNSMPDGSCRTIKSQYDKTAIYHTQVKGTYGATMVAIETSNADIKDERLYSVRNGKVKFIGKRKEVEYTLNIKDAIYKIRRLTAKECWRLMGLSFEDCEKAKSIGVADSHLYHQAGNGIVTDCVTLIAEHLYKAIYNHNYICYDENF